MEALMELCDLIAEDPVEFGDKLSWICGRCPPPEIELGRVTRSQLNAILAVSRFLSKSQSHLDGRPKSICLAFYRAIPASFAPSFWPQSFAHDLIVSFYNDYLGYVCKASDLSVDFAADVAGLTGEIVMSSFDNVSISRIFLNALAHNFPTIVASDATSLLFSLIDRLDIPIPSSPDAPSYMSSPVSGTYYQRASPGNEIAASSNSVADDGTSAIVVSGAVAYMRAFEQESVESLEKKEITLKLIGQIVSKVSIEPDILEQVRVLAKEQLRSMLIFLKTRKRDWSQQGQLLKAKINANLSVYKAAARLQIKTFASLDLDGKSAKGLLHRSFALLIESAEACLLSVWRKMRVCEELFSALLAGISQAAVARGGQLLHILLIRFKPIVLETCVQADTFSGSQGLMFESVLRTCCEIIKFEWNKDRAPVEDNRSPVDTFIKGLATRVRERNDHAEEDGKEKQAASPEQLNLIRLLADITVSVNKPEVVDMILPRFIETLEEGDASNPGLLRLRLIDAVSRMAGLGFEKSYREAVVLMTRSYLSKLSSIGSAESKTVAPEATTERVEALPAGFLLIASDLTSSKLRLDYRHRLLSLCSDVGLAAESKSGRSGADFLGPLLPAVAEICSDFDPSLNVEPSLLKLFRNLWFYIALFGLAPPIQKVQIATKPVSTSLNSTGSMGATGLQAVYGPYMFNAQWCSAVQRISQGTPPLVVSSVKWLEDELELNALHNPGSRSGNGNEKAAVSRRTALSAALGGLVEVSSMSTISGVKATYLLAVAFLEIIRFISNGGILNGGPISMASQSAFSCVFEYLKSSSLMPAVSQCLTAIVHRAFETAMAWLDERTSETGCEADNREFTLAVHACFLIKNLSQRDEHIRDISVKLLIQLRDRFPQVLWNSSCLDSLLFYVHNDPPSALVTDPAWVATVRSLYQKIVREWIVVSLSHAPCSTQGLLQEKLCKANTLQRTQPTTDVVSLLSEIRIGTGKNDCWTGTKTANIPAVMAAAAAASGENVKLTEAFNLEVLSIGMVSATVKCNHAGEIAGMRRLYESIGGLDPKAIQGGSDLTLDIPASGGVSKQQPGSFNDLLLTKFVRLLQKFVNAAEKGGEVDKSSFRESCSQATALLLSNLGSDSKANVQNFSQLLRLLCWCPAYILTPDAMETGVFIWTWLVSAAPELGPLVLSELVDAWLWTVDTKRGLFASEARCCGPAAKLRPHLEPGDPEAWPEKDPVEQIMAHRLWLGYFIDRFEVVRQDSVEELLLIGRLVQGTTRSPQNFSQHPAAAGTFFTAMILGLKFCACRSQLNLQNFSTGLQLLEDRVYRASLGWFAHTPQWYDMRNSNFAQSEAVSVSVFVQHLQNDWGDVNQNGNNSMDQCHPVWGYMENYAVGREKRKQLLLMLCQHEADRLEVWAQPVNTKDNGSRPKISSEKWVEYARTSFSVDPQIAFCLASRFPSSAVLKNEVTQLVQKAFIY
ncbi:hypothetical protein Leryth_011580 [Lithospermum erythrorhizon]|nr:hypothetical protein Leryth_011580 [Lithospermum erythrorhizon]